MDVKHVIVSYNRASVSGLLRPFLSFGLYPLNLHSFIRKCFIIKCNLISLLSHLSMFLRAY